VVLQKSELVSFYSMLRSSLDYFSLLSSFSLDFLLGSVRGRDSIYLSRDMVIVDSCLAFPHLIDRFPDPLAFDHHSICILLYLSLFDLWVYTTQ